jgi:hypothetical protein
MAIPTNSLGPFSFVTLHVPSDRGAPPIIPAMDAEIVQRAGVDGSAVQRLGVKAQPFQMRSGVDLLSFADANTQLALYMEYQNFEALGLIWGGVDYQSNFSTLYLPVRIEPIRIRKISGAVGGINGSAATAWLEALWTLLPIRVE